ncbi:hypothetical protein EU805_15775 [Salipiger sp. IMCC34102]|uniref:sulfotransferase family 2 domain-containing protein n=1 Tax=Salipiger sp. IMCC34102 TaxID=2510647 RepID=UPI00101D903B|nr:sulfotransferase family 2 domain-containing protein [Salipiger sp. IMCC34102]RYH01056.1 hypothetical protein EU805_15775 [Salipiger sp. IMCC34102]
MHQSFGKTSNTAFLAVIIEALKEKWHLVNKEKTVHATLNRSKYQNVHRFENSNSPEVFSNFDNKFIISIRNPYTRVLSLYLHVTHSGSTGLSPNWQKKLNHGEGIISFEKFLNLLSSVGIDNIDGHTFPISTKSLLGEADYDYVIRFESFENDVKEMAKSYFDFDVNVPRKGVRTNSSNNIENHYTDECIDIVRRLYAEDFRVLGYPLDIELATQLPNLSQNGLRVPDLYIKEILN